MVGDITTSLDERMSDFGGVVGDLPVVSVAIREHGELGPVLVDPAHEFTGPDDLDDDVRGESA